MEMIHFLHKILPISQKEFKQLLNMRWLNSTALTVPVIHTVIFTGTNLNQWIPSLHAPQTLIWIEQQWKRIWGKISCRSQQILKLSFSVNQGYVCLILLFTTVLCSPLWLKHIIILIGTKSSEMAFNYSKHTPAVGGTYCWECETEGKATVHLFRLYCCHYCLWIDIMFLFTCIIIQYCTGKRYSINNAYYENRKYTFLNKIHVAL